nr:hypothetical protein [Capnocytophaga canis]
MKQPLKWFEKKGLLCFLPETLPSKLVVQHHRIFANETVKIPFSKGYGLDM